MGYIIVKKEKEKGVRVKSQNEREEFDFLLVLYHLLSWSITITDTTRNEMKSSKYSLCFNNSEKSPFVKISDRAGFAQHRTNELKLQYACLDV